MEVLSDYILVALIAICSALAGVVPSTGRITDNRKKFPKNINPRGWFTFFCLSIVVTATITQLIVSKEKEKHAQIEQVKKDSINKVVYNQALTDMKMKYDTSNLKTITTITETLGKYGYKLDSSSNRLVKILRDSTRSKVVESVSPTLSLCPGDDPIKYEKVDYETIKVVVKLCSIGSGSTNFKVNYDFIFETTSGKFHVSTFNDFLPKDLRLPYLVGEYKAFTFRTDEDVENIYVRLYGSYTNLEKNRIYKANDMYVYNVSSKVVSLPTKDNRAKVADLIEQWKKTFKQ